MPAVQHMSPIAPGWPAQSHSLAAAHHDGNLHALAGGRSHLAGNRLQHGGVNAKALGALQRLAADLEHHSPEGWKGRGTQAWVLIGSTVAGVAGKLGEANNAGLLGVSQVGTINVFGNAGM